MRPLPISTIALMSAIFFLTACGVTEFSSSSANSSNKASGLNTTSENDSTDASLSQEACDAAEASGTELDGCKRSCDDESSANLPQMTAGEAIAAIEDILNGQDPTAANLEGIIEGEFEPLRCYISGGGGHGMDMCMKDTTAVAGLAKRGARGSFIEIKGSQLCVPPMVLINNEALFAGAVTGECQ